MDVILIAAVTQDGFIARHSQETIKWSKDLSLFKKQTMGWPVIMGSNTFNCINSVLKNREIIVMGRDDSPQKTLEAIDKEKCFIAGGGKTNARFASYLTHLYITPHPNVFGSGVSLFSGAVKEMNLVFEAILPVDKTNGIFQFQYRVNGNKNH